jgi:integrase/DNA-directed RNA polymerase subunit RPC12/RpoP
MVEIRCFQCGSSRIYKAGVRRSLEGPIQRFLCCSCGRRFSEPSKKRDVTGKLFAAADTRENHHQVRVAAGKTAFQEASNDLPFSLGENVCSHNLTTIEKQLYTLPYSNSNYRVSATTKAKNLEKTQPQETGLRAEGTTDAQTQADVKGKLVQYTFWMDKKGYSLETVRLNRTALKVLAERGATLDSPESVKEVIAGQKIWGEARKRNVINAYSLFLKLQGQTWEKPRTNVTQKFPFIPKEEEIDALVSGTGPKTATFLQLLKETAMRCGEAKRLQWINIDSEKNIITLNDPEKRSNARMWKVSQKLIGMLNTLPRESQKVFGDSSINSMKVTFQKARKRLAAKLANPRLQEISFHTLRHWKATQLYHQTRDPYYVKQFLGHKSLKNTEIYINIERTLFEPGSDEFTVKVTDKAEEVKGLLEVGFEYVCQKDSLIFLRKRK